MLEARQVKVQTYGAGIRLINRLIMKITALADNDFGRLFDRLNSKNKYRNEVVFPSPLPRDESIELDRSMKRLDAGLSSKRFEMQRMGLSQREIEKIKEDIEHEREELAELEFSIGQKFMDDASIDEEITPPKVESMEPKPRSGNPNPVRPNPDSMGASVSNSHTENMMDG